MTFSSKARSPGQRSQHDPCHNFDLYHWCYCTCTKCWRNEGIAMTEVREDGKKVIRPSAKGTYICQDCPCKTERAMVNPPNAPVHAPERDRHRASFATAPMPARLSGHRRTRA